MPSACDAAERRSVREHFHNVEASPIAFCMRCGPNVWLTTSQERTRSCVCMACVDAPRLPWGFCILPLPVHLDTFIHPSKEQQLFLILQAFVQAFLQVSVVLTVLCAPSSTLSISTYLPISISSFSSAASLFFATYLFFLLLCLLSLSPSPLRSLLRCTEWLLQASSFLHLCHYFSTVRRFVHSHSSRTSRPKTGIRDDSSFSDLLLRSTFSQAFVFNFPPVGDIWKERPGSFDMRALICLNPVPCLTQASRKSAQIGEPELDRGHNMAVNHKGRGGGGYKKGGGPAENVPYRFQLVQRCQTCGNARVTCTHIKKTKEIIFISYFWLLARIINHSCSWEKSSFCYQKKKKSPCCLR